MADIIQDVILRVSSDAEELRKGVGQVDDKIKDTQKNTGGLQNQFKKLLPALGVAAIVAGFKKIAQASLQAADVQAKAEQKLLVAANGRIGVQQKLIKQAQENGWSVSFPMWEDDIKDAADAIQRYGKLYTLKSIIDARISNNTKISAKMRIG